MGNAMKNWTTLSFFVLLLVVVIVTVVVGSFASNTTCANVLLPIVTVLGDDLPL
jgi:di/tricarboxylate transporter